MSAKEKEPPALMVAFSSVAPKTLLDDYDVADVDRSPLRYAAAVSSVADNLMSDIDRFEGAHIEVIDKFSRLSSKLNAKYVDSPRLSDGENLLLADRQQALAQRIDLGIESAKEQILSIKSQAEDISARIDRINHMTNSLSELAALENERRPTFAFLVENAVRIVNNSRQRLDFFAAHQNFIENIIKRWLDWSEDYKAFKTVKREEFIKNCTKARIDQTTWEELYGDWQSKRFLIEQRFLPLVEFALKGNLLSKDDTESAAEQVLSLLETHKYDVDDLYILDRRNIAQKFYRLTEKFRRSLQPVLDGRARTEERLFLSQWAEPLLRTSQ